MKQVYELSRKDGLELFNKQVFKLFGISGKQWIANYRNGVYDQALKEDVDTRYIEIWFLLPLVEKGE